MLINEPLLQGTFSDNVSEMQFEVFFELLWDNLDYPSIWSIMGLIFISDFAFLLGRTSSATASAIAISWGDASTMGLLSNARENISSSKPSWWREMVLG